MRTKKANKLSQKRLKSAQKSLKKEDIEGFYNEVLKALWGYLGDKLTVQASLLNRETVKSELTNRKVTPEITDELLQILDTCEYAKFAPSMAGEQPENIYKQTAKLIQNLEKELSANKK